MREQLARAAREVHFAAVASETVNGTALLVIAETFAGLAMSIPMSPTRAMPGGLVDTSTLLATQILQHDSRPDDDAVVTTESR